MRKVKNNIQSSNPAVLFAAGVESIINDPMIKPSQHDASDLSDLQRRASKPESRGNLYNSLLRQFANL